MIYSKKVQKNIPEKEADGNDISETQSSIGAAVIKHKRNDRHINAPDHQWMRLGKIFQVLIPE